MTTNNKNPRIFIDKRGNWFQDGIKITHIWTYLSNNRNLDVDEDGNFFVDEGTGRVDVEVEDTPFVVKMVHRKNGQFFLNINDQTVEKLDFDTLVTGDNNVLYVKIKDRKFDARFTRSAYYEFMKSVDYEDGEYFVENNGLKHRIESRS